MIPSSIEAFVKTLETPDFFTKANRPQCDAIHADVWQCVEEGTETVTFTVDAELHKKVEAVLKAYGWTVEEAVVLFLMWCAVRPDAFEAWVKETHSW